MNELKKETSPSRVALKLEIGNLVVDVKKLNWESSFLVETQLGVAGIRGTQFGFSADSKFTRLALLEGKITFQDSKKQTKNLAANQKIEVSKEGAGKILALSESEKKELKKTVKNKEGRIYTT